ncbi:MAG: M13 family peptidase [Brevundimonas sp.]|uniref:M13 family metallopeptidase n=1 Tax=Brevundimonas sp. TaxID=1871086 RepID=UPI00121FE048|nr:M13-type metalloendopeptidase [Brevundimonas sp.]RZJ18493.1 MAG: M13 family peptidase [Brevundimonas sp.]
MKLMLVGAALGALMIPAAALAHEDHVCLDQTCTVQALFDASLFEAPAGGAGWQGVAAPKYGTWGFDLSGRDTSVQPGDDFFRYANGKAVDAIQIPADRTSYGAFALLRELSDNRMKTLIEGLNARTDLTPGSDAAKVAGLYHSYMDADRIETLDGRPLEPYLTAIRAAESHADMARVMGATQGRFGRAIVGTYIAADAKAPDRYAVYLGQGGISLPTRDYYLSPLFTEKKEKYQAYVARMLEMAGWDQPAQAAAAIVALETRIAEAHWTPEQSRDRNTTYNAMTQAELAAYAPGFDWSAYLGAMGLGDVRRLVVQENTAFPQIAAIFAETPVATWQAWEAFHTIDQAAPYLSARFSDARWAFRSRDLEGQPEQRSRDKRAVSFAESGLGEALGKLYVAEYFPPESKAKMDELVANLRVALAGRIRQLDWMGEATKQEALAKLESFSVKIGYPDKWRDYSDLQVRSDDLLGNAERSSTFKWQYSLNRINDPVDRAEWRMTPQTVNATYNSTLNEITFPAGILQPPFFDPDADPAVNYGGIGGVIGHEIGHGFDDQGRKSDGAGVLRDWWTPEDGANFDARTARLGAQFAEYEPLPGHKVKPGLTMGENIGDLAGITLGLEAYRLSLHGQPSPVLDGVTGDQRVFYGWAQVWASKYRDDAMKQLVASNPHSPPQFRVIGPVRNLDAWYDAFGVREGQAYYVAPEDRVRLW